MNIKLYGLIVTGSEQRSMDETVIAKEGDKFWVVIEPEGWVSATSVGWVDNNKVPFDLKTWNTKEEAEDFGKTWKGHPWWCSPKSYKIIVVEPKFKQVFDGFVPCSNSNHAGEE